MLPAPPVEPTSSVRPLAQRSWLWLAGLAGLLLCLCGVPYLLSSVVVSGSIRSLITVAVLGLFLALTIMDKVLVSAGTAATGTPPRQAWHCSRCDRTWQASAPRPVPPAGFGSCLSTAALRAANIARTIILPWKPAAFLFAPRHRLAPADRIVEMLSRLRVVLGVAIVVGVAVWYNSYGRLELASFLKSWLVTGLLAIPSCLICMGLFLALTRASLRRAATRQMKWPALSLISFVGTLALLGLFIMGANYVSGRIKFYAPDVSIPLDGVVYGGVFGLWLLIFCLRSAYLVTQNWFNAVDGNLLLTPAIATWMAWLVAAKSLIFEDSVDGVPGAVSLVLILGGAAATTGVAALEAWRAVRLYGVTLRGGPWASGKLIGGGSGNEQVVAAIGLTRHPDDGSGNGRD